jgi:hypothetical protein
VVAQTEANSSQQVTQGSHASLTVTNQKTATTKRKRTPTTKEAEQVSSSYPSLPLVMNM